MTERERNHFEKVRDAADALLSFDKFIYTNDEYDAFVNHFAEIVDEEELEEGIEVVRCFLDILKTTQIKKKKMRLAEMKEEIRDLLVEYKKLSGDCDILYRLEEWQRDENEICIDLQDVIDNF